MTESSPESMDTRWNPAAFYRPFEDLLECTLCPHRCRLDEGDVGRCLVRRRRGAILETRTFSSAVLNLDPIETKCLYHFLPGIRALTTAAPGCNLTCHYCQNFRLSQFGRSKDALGTARAIDPEALVAEASRLSAAIAFSYSEPILGAELTLAVARHAMRRRVPVVWKTNGFMTDEALSEVAGCVSAANVDLKAGDDESYRALCGGALRPILDTIQGFLQAGVWVEVSTPVIPGFNSDRRSICRLADLIRSFGKSIPWHLVRYNPEFRWRHILPTPPRVLEEAVKWGRAAGLDHVYVERALGARGRATACPECGTAVVDRGRDSVRCSLKSDGSCPVCENKVGGVWEDVF